LGKGTKRPDSFPTSTDGTCSTLGEQKACTPAQTDAAQKCSGKNLSPRWRKFLHICGWVQKGLFPKGAGATNFAQEPRGRATRPACAGALKNISLRLGEMGGLLTGTGRGEGDGGKVVRCTSLIAKIQDVIPQKQEEPLNVIPWSWKVKWRAAAIRGGGFLG